MTHRSLEKFKNQMAQSIVLDQTFTCKIKHCVSKDDFFSTKTIARKRGSKASQIKPVLSSKRELERCQNKMEVLTRIQHPGFDKRIKNTMATTDEEDSLFLQFKKIPKKAQLGENSPRNLIKPRMSQPIALKVFLPGDPISNVVNIDEFILIGKLGEGTYSEVYKAVHLKTNCLVALKVLSKERMRNLKVEENLVREIKLQQYLNHPNLIQLYGYFYDKYNVYLICELCTGGNCYELMNRLKRTRKTNGLTVDETGKIIKQLCKGIHHMHKNNIMHRDIKPQNMLLTVGKNVKLGDFGWSVYNSESKLRKTICGTPLYLAPELINHHQYTSAVDVWAVGVLTYQFLSGEMPFKVRDIRELSKIVNQQVDYQLIINQPAKNFIIQILQKQPQNRPNVQELLNHQFLLKLRKSQKQIS